MIQQQTILNVSDNSGAKTAKCIKVLNGFKKKTGTIGDIITISIKKLRETKKVSKVKKGEIYKALIIRTKKATKNSHCYSSFSDNAVILLDKQNNFIGTRIIGPVPKKNKKKYY